MKNIVIIGAGLGGLTAGALLSKKGYKVTILEQHNKVGGCATTFKRNGNFACEVGLHAMDAAFTDKKKKWILDELKVYDNIEFIKPNEFFRIKSDTIDFIMPDKKEKAIVKLTDKYPKEAQAIKKYFTLIDSICNEYDNLPNISWWQFILFPFIYKNIFKYKTKSVKEVLDSFIKNEELKLILNTNVGYYHDTVDKFSFLYHSIGQNSYFTGSGWYIKGGSQKLSNYLASIIKSNNGKVVTIANAVKIKLNGNAATSIVYEHKKEKVEIFSDILISNLSPSQTYKIAGITYKEDKKIASSLLTIYIGFNKNIKNIYGQKPYSTFLLRDIRSIKDYDNSIKNEITKRGFVFVDYSQIDSNLTDENKSFGAICTTDYLSDWRNLAKNEYELKKKDILKSYLSELEKEYPNIKEYIEFAEIGTAKTMNRYLKTPEGTAYGFAPNNRQFFRIPQIKSKKLRNLYFAGAWVIGGGFSPAIISGGMCFDRIYSQKR